MNATVSALWRYPVKSMLGEQCDAVEIDARGVWGDRRFAVRDAEGRPCTRKSGSRRFGHAEGIFSLGARYAGERLEIAFPDGRRMPGDDPAIDAALSEALRQPVTLAREAGAPYFDASPIHLLTTGSLDWLRAKLPGSRIDERRFRPNIVLDTAGPELSWIGRTLHIGTVRLRVTDPTGRCGMTTFAQGDLPFDPKVLRCIAQEAGEDFGVYAEVIQPGRIAQGDAVIVE
jgi:uncharacterized protein YcbX